MYTCVYFCKNEEITASTHAKRCNHSRVIFLTRNMASPKAIEFNNCLHICEIEITFKIESPRQQQIMPSVNTFIKCSCNLAALYPRRIPKYFTYGVRLLA